MRARGECGPSIAEGVPLGTGAVDALRWTPTVRVFSPLREKERHTPAESAKCTHARPCTLRDTARTLSRAHV